MQIVLDSKQLARPFVKVWQSRIFWFLTGLGLGTLGFLLALISAFDSMVGAF